MGLVVVCRVRVRGCVYGFTCMSGMCVCVWLFGYINCSYLANMRLQIKNPSATVWFHISHRGSLERLPAEEASMLKNLL